MGVLILSSDSAFKVILAAEDYYLYLTDNLKHINVPNLEKKIIFYVNDNCIFSILSCDNVSLLDRPHKMSLITLLVKKYSSIRLYSYGKLFSSSIKSSQYYTEVNKNNIIL